VVKFTTSFAFVLALGGLANAADIPAKAPSLAIAPAYNWTGPYLGIQGGWGLGTSHHATPTLPSPPFPDFSGNFDVNGGLFGMTAGYNYQIGAMVAGVEGDISGAWMSGSTAGRAPIFCPPGGAAANCTTKLYGLETLRARLGYAWDRFLPYATGGLAVGQVYAATDPGNANGGTTSRAGYAVGGGLEAMLLPNLTAKAEYLYVDFGTMTGLFIRNPGAFRFDVDMRAHILRVGLNYKFN
jgi:outer membrane immunogenic protein